MAFAGAVLFGALALLDSGERTGARRSELDQQWGPKCMGACIHPSLMQMLFIIVLASLYLVPTSR
jgi:hypothetical protein